MTLPGVFDSDWVETTPEYRSRSAVGKVFAVWRTGANQWTLRVRDQWVDDEAPVTDHPNLTWRQAMEITEAIIALEG